jgi:3-hydroxyisobutyrate dehydrogenase-like beta-hydroxyacid dehydrogenase
MKIAVLGLGRMGQAFAHRLGEGGHDLAVWDRSPGKADELVEAGATEAASPDEAIASADVAISSLANDEAVRAVALGAGGIRSAIGSRPYVDVSTISPSLSGELGRDFDRFVALPVLGAPQAVRAGEATYLAGGAPETIDQLQPVLESLGGRVKRFARPELASTAKVSVNLLLLSGLAILAEGFTVGRAGGLTDDELDDLLRDSAVVAPGLKNRFDAVLHGSGPVWWTTVLGAKDVGLATDLAASAGHQLRLGPVVRDAYQAAADAGFAGEDVAAVASLYE